MTKREALILTLAGSLATSGVGRYEDHYARAERLVDEVLAEGAHEMAEEGREVMGPRALPSGAEPERIARYVAGWHDALDHVDPEVTS
ncbi:hypothetical protein J7I94_19190 [Streptomyces sp. ISL-12]|uniref:hypothetical protein n=1 Tax=Streptomyces sp. ISL-12 TaxID=2819177 RepID=UPI001BEA4EF4|nr:hypothetical protein [Streptomyces sp. ISL-12]MBT2412660.1 hypothetical protein [Streptomyces sp. ISL-12]